MRKLILSLTIAACSLVYGAQVSQAALVFGNDITAAQPSSSNPFTTGQVVAANIVVSGIEHGSGINPNNAANRYNFNSWTSASLDTNDYFSFTITPDSGYSVSFTNFIYTGQRSGSGPVSFAFRSSSDNFASNIGTPTATGTTIDLSSFANLTTSITFRLFAWGANNASGTFSINDFAFNGSVAQVAAVPEPTSLLLAGITGIGTFGAWRRKRGKAISA